MTHIITQGHLLLNAKKKFNWSGLFGVLVFLGGPVLAIMLTVTIAEPFALLILLAICISWGIGCYFSDPDKIDVIKRNYKYSKIIEPDSWAVNTSIRLLTELFKFSKEAELFTDVDNIVFELVNLIDLAKTDSAFLDDVGTYNDKLDEFIEQCVAERNRAEAEQRELVKVQVSFSTIDNAIELAEESQC
jgi:hypothetical protein